MEVMTEESCLNGRMKELAGCGERRIGRMGPKVGRRLGAQSLSRVMDFRFKLGGLSSNRLFVFRATPPQSFPV